MSLASLPGSPVGRREVSFKLGTVPSIEKLDAMDVDDSTAPGRTVDADADVDADAGDEPSKETRAPSERPPAFLRSVSVFHRSPSVGDACSCDSLVSKVFKSLLPRDAPVSLAKALSNLHRYMDEIGSRDAPKVCFRHTIRMAGQLGLMSGNLQMQALLERLITVYERRAEISLLKTDNATYQWFRKGHRPVHPADGLGLYKFSHHQHPPFEPNLVLLTEKVASSDVLRSWVEDGSVVLPGLFD